MSKFQTLAPPKAFESQSISTKWKSTKVYNIFRALVNFCPTFTITYATNHQGKLTNLKLTLQNSSSRLYFKMSFLFRMFACFFTSKTIIKGEFQKYQSFYNNNLTWIACYNLPHSNGFKYFWRSIVIFKHLYFDPNFPGIYD